MIIPLGRNFSALTISWDYVGFILRGEPTWFRFSPSSLILGKLISKEIIDGDTITIHTVEGDWVFQPTITRVFYQRLPSYSKETLTGCKLISCPDQYSLLNSMQYTGRDYQKYIIGAAELVKLMTFD